MKAIHSPLPSSPGGEPSREQVPSQKMEEENRNKHGDLVLPWHHHASRWVDIEWGCQVTCRLMLAVRDQEWQVRTGVMMEPLRLIKHMQPHKVISDLTKNEYFLNVGSQARRRKRLWGGRRWCITPPLSLWRARILGAGQLGILGDCGLKSGWIHSPQNLTFIQGKTEMLKLGD